MAWIRRSRTGSGATAVQIFESVHGRRQMVKHVGSAHTEAELGVLLQQAELLLAGQGQDALDVDVEPAPVKAELLKPPADQDEVLLDPQDEDEQPAKVPARVATPRVASTSSQLLFEVLATVYDDLGLGVVRMRRSGIW